MTAVKQVKPQRPKDYGSNNYRSIYSHIARKSPILSLPERAWSMHYAFADFSTYEGLMGILQECRERLKTKKLKLENVLEEIHNNLKKMQLTGKAVEFPDPKNLYKWDGIRKKELDTALAHRDVAQDEVNQVQRDIKKVTDSQLKVAEKRKKEKPYNTVGAVKLYGGKPVLADGMKVVMVDEIPTIDEYEYYAGMTLSDYIQNVVLPFKKKQSAKAKKKERKMAELIENGHYPEL